MRSPIRAIGLASLIAAVSACSAPAIPSCPPGLGPPVTVFTLFLGKAVPGRGDVSDKEFQAFLDDTITANLPNGYTILDANGAWMNPMTRKTIKEATKVLVVALPDQPESLAAVNRIRNSYQFRFHQQRVGMTVEQGCGSF